MHTAESTLAIEPACSPHDPRRARGGFTLMEVLIATSILGVAVGMTMVVYVAALKRARHTELVIQGTSELRYAADYISQNVRSAAQLPQVKDVVDGGTTYKGVQLLVAPKDVASLVVEAGTWLDSPANTVQGWKANQNTLQISVVPSAATASVFKGNARPAGAIGAGDIATYFDTSAKGIDPNDLVKAGDSITIPATQYGSAVTLVVKNISQNGGKNTITFTNKLDRDVPDGTAIRLTVARRMRFEVVVAAANRGDLRYYPDSDANKFTVLAREITPTPLTDTADVTKGTTTPFALQPGASNTVVINLQKIPAGTSVGRTLQGVQTLAVTRTNPAAP